MAPRTQLDRGFRFAPRLEALESRLAPARLVNASTVVYRDVDGDVVRVELSRPRLTSLDVANDVFHFSIGGVGPPGSVLPLQQLQTIDLTVLARNDLSLSVRVDPDTGGDGRANIGYLNSSGFDLDVVRIRGDLGRLDAGNGDFTTPGLEELRVRSLGALGGPDVVHDVAGRLGLLQVTTDVVDTILTARSIGAVVVNGSIDSARVQALPGRIGSVTVGGSLVGGAAPAIIVSGSDMGPVDISLNINSGIIHCGGNLASVTVGGSLTAALLANTGVIQSTGAMGPVRIGGHITGGFGSNSGKIVAGGRLDSVVVGGNVTGIGADSGVIESTGGGIGRVRVNGSLNGGTGDRTGRVTAAGGIGRVAIGGQILGAAGENSGGITSGGNLGLARVGFLSTGGIVGGTGLQSGRVVANGRLDAVEVRGDLRGGVGPFSGIISAGRMGPVAIGGSVQGGNGTFSGAIASLGRIVAVDIGGNLRNNAVSVGGGVGGGSIRAGNSLGTVTVGGFIEGHADNPVRITGRGQAVPGEHTDVAIETVRITGDVQYAEILGGYNVGGAAVNGDAQIGIVRAGGIWLGSSVAAGIAAGADGDFGTLDDFVIPGGSDDIRAKITRINQAGGIEHTIIVGDHFGLVAEKIDEWRVEGVDRPLNPGPHNDFAVPMAPGDLALHEL